MRKSFIPILFLLGAFFSGCASNKTWFAQKPKKALVVTVTTGFRHSSIKTAESILAKLGEESGAFSVDYLQQPANQPQEPTKPSEPKAPKAQSDPTKQKAQEEKYQADLL